MEGILQIEPDRKTRTALLDFINKNTDINLLPAALDFLIAPRIGANNRQIIVFQGKQIVGCNLFTPAQVYIDGMQKYVYWSHNTYLKPEYRRKYGLALMMLSAERENVIGFGLTQINKKLQQLIGSQTVAVSNAYRIEVGGICTDAIAPNRILTRDSIFYRIFNIKDMYLPSDGFWNKHSLAIDFVRNAQFLEQRFMSMLDTYYYVYQRETGCMHYSKDSAYFVICIKRINGNRISYLVDYRYNLAIGIDAMYDIVNAASHFSASMGTKNLFVFSTDVDFHIDKIYGEQAQIMSNTSILQGKKVLITPADSDDELIFI